MRKRLCCGYVCRLFPVALTILSLLFDANMLLIVSPRPILTVFDMLRVLLMLGILVMFLPVVIMTTVTLMPIECRVPSLLTRRRPGCFFGTSGGSSRTPVCPMLVLLLPMLVILATMVELLVLHTAFMWVGSMIFWLDREAHCIEWA